MLKKFDSKKLYVLSWTEGLLIGPNAKFLARRIRDASMWEITQRIGYINCDQVRPETILNAHINKGSVAPEKIDREHPKLVIAMCKKSEDGTFYFFVSDDIVKICRRLMQGKDVVIQICVLEPLRGKLEEMELPTLIDTLLKIKES